MTTKADIQHNFLPAQYDETNAPRINHNYLSQQFADYDQILPKIGELVKRMDFTLGRSVDEFESRICELTGSKYCVGVGSGTDAIFLSLKAAGIKEGDEVITTSYTFYATIGAIVTAGARPVFVDIGEDYNIDPEKIQEAITPKTKAIVPVHWAGLPCRMNEIMAIADKHGLAVIEDSCHGIRADYHGKPAGTFGLTGCFSMHPLKNLNVWGDGGYLVTDSREMHDKLVLMRNHGLVDRDTCVMFAYNSRLDSLQAIVANHLLNKIEHVTDSRIRNAARYDEKLAGVSQIHVPARPEGVKQVYHLYCIQVLEKRDELQEFLVKNDVDAKIHYPIPMHLQPAAKEYGYKKGDLPRTEQYCENTMSLPVHEFVTQDDVDYVAGKIQEFYGQS